MKPQTCAKARELVWGNLIHLSYNMWGDRKPHDSWIKGHPCGEDIYAKPYLRFDEPLWNELLERMADIGMNMVVLDLGDAVRYASHPEIAVKGAWSVKKLRRELDRMRKLGLEPIPKLNFSAGHDAWLGDYSRCVSTPLYYQVCRDLIQEVSEIFDTPRFFHIGMDEETVSNQQSLLVDYVCCRLFELWWHDLQFYVDTIAETGSRAWMWSDYAWGKGMAPAPRKAPKKLHKDYARTLGHEEIFFERMPKSVVQSNWYYEMTFDESKVEVTLFDSLARRGYEQIPTGSNFSGPDNFPPLVEYIEQKTKGKGILGYLQTCWFPTLPAYRNIHIKAIDGIAEAMRICAKTGK